MNMTNLHFHGLHVSPDAPGVDVLSTMAMPGESLHYTVDIPADQPTGLYWYHTRQHGESYQQNLDGMSGAIIIDGMDRYFPEIRNMKEKIRILRDAELEQSDPSSAVLAPYGYGAATGEATRVFTVNGVVRPKIAIASGDKQLWRIVNASPDLYADLEVDSESMTVVALDGMPLAYHNPKHRTEVFQRVLLAPAGRVEAIVTGPKAGTRASLRSRCVDTGADGDPNREMVLADLDESARDTNPKAPHDASAQPAVSQPAVYRPLAQSAINLP